MMDISRLMKKKKNRIANYELMRIMSCLFIISTHMMALYVDIWNRPLSFNKVVGVLYAGWDILGVDLFIVISSSFFTRDRNAKITDRMKRRYYKALMIALQAVILIMTAYIAMNGSFSLEIVKTAAYDFVRHKYWYVRAYIALLAVSPFLDELIKRPGFGTPAAISIFLLDFVPVFCNSSKLWKDVLHFAMIYTLTGLMNGYLSDKLSKRNCILALCMGALISQAYYWTAFLNEGIRGHLPYPMNGLSSRYSPVMVICAIASFMIAAKSKPIHADWIVRLAEGTLAVYIWHVAGQDRIAGLLRVTELYNSKWWFAGMIGVVVTIYLVFSVAYIICIYALNLIKSIGGQATKKHLKNS